jgi:carbon-monoxide dehydrogenase medium subunit
VKPAPFDYHAPTTVAEAARLLRDLGEDARPLAGGQSLVPLMALRLSRPAHLVDLNGVVELGGIEPSDDGGLVVGALARQRATERSPLVAERCPLMTEALPFLAHPAIRTRGTIGGSVAHADPAAELPAVCVALDARLVACSAAGERTIAASDFFVSHFTTALAADEILTAVQVPPPEPRTGWAFDEVSRRHGDFALVAAAAMIRLQGDTIAEARLAFAGVSETPVRVAAAEARLVGERPNDKLFEAAAGDVAGALDPPDDLHATVRYRRHVAALLTRRLLARAATRAEEAQ